MNWNHSRIMSTADDGTAVVVDGDNGWEAMPFGMDGGSRSTCPTREEAIEMVETMRGDIICCVGHLAEDSDR